MAVRMLWKFVVGRTKTLFKNYNVVERAEKEMEHKRRSSPRHPGTEAKFKVLIKERPDIEADVDRKHVELLDRLKIVKVTSQDTEQDEQTEGRPLPQRRFRSEMPEYGYEVPKTIPEGRCSLQQALEFMSNHHSDPSAHSIATIAQTYKMKASDVQQVVDNFRPFQIFVSQDKKIGYSMEGLKALGINKVVQPLYKVKFADHEEEATKDKIEDKK